MSGKTIIVNHSYTLNDIGNYSEKGVVFLHDENFDIFTVDVFNSNKSAISERVRRPVGLAEYEISEADLTEAEEEDEL